MGPPWRPKGRGHGPPWAHGPQGPMGEHGPMGTQGLGPWAPMGPHSTRFFDIYAFLFDICAFFRIPLEREREREVTCTVCNQYTSIETCLLIMCEPCIKMLRDKSYIAAKLSASPLLGFLIRIRPSTNAHPKSSTILPQKATKSSLRIPK